MPREVVLLAGASVDPGHLIAAALAGVPEADAVPFDAGGGVQLQVADRPVLTVIRPGHSADQRNPWAIHLVGFPSPSDDGGLEEFRTTPAAALPDP